jgi:hypothetical protein
MDVKMSNKFLDIYLFQVKKKNKERRYNMHPDFMNPVEFRKWLERNKNKIVGYPLDSYHCPIANWLKDMDVEFECVGANKIVIDSGNAPDIGEIIYPLPEWAIMFVSLVDKCGDDDYGSQNNGIMGFQALKILDYCLSQTNNVNEANNTEGYIDIEIEDDLETLEDNQEIEKLEVSEEKEEALCLSHS